MGISARPLLHRRSERNQISRVMFNMEAGVDESCGGGSALLNAALEHHRRCFMGLLLQRPDSRDATGEMALDEVYSCFTLLEQHHGLCVSHCLNECGTFTAPGEKDVFFLH